MQNYNAIGLGATVLGLYFLSNFLVKRQKMSLMRHRKIWNSILAVSFFMVGSLGLVLAVMIDQKTFVDWYRQMVWMHVESGIVMAMVSIMHFAWHITYYFPPKTKTV